MTSASEYRAATARTWVGLGFALALVAYTAWLFTLALAVWPQGLPQDYDTQATMSREAVLVSKLTLLGFFVSPPLLVASIACLVSGTWRSRAVASIRIVSALLLALSVAFGLFGLRTWLGFGW
jgi:hypothetical protein